MAQISINVCMDEDLKYQFELLCEEIGISVETAFCLFVKTAVREHRIPFTLSLTDDPFYRKDNIKRLEKAATDLEAGKGSIHELIEDDE